MQNENDRSEIDTLLDQAQIAACRMADSSIAQVEQIVRAVARACADKAEFYAEWAVRETGYGRVESKIQKNRINSEPWLTVDVAEFIRPRVDVEKKIASLPKPAGVVLALIPVTNPICTVYFKVLIALQTRNAVILSPHPGARECTRHALDYLNEVAVAAGAPEHAIQMISNPTVPLVQAMMADDRNSVTLATGGPAMVRAAYSSSNPALGVGPGNVPAYVDRTADVAKAAERIVRSKSFDNSLLCTSESVIIADLPVAEQLKRELVRSKAYLVEGAEERRKLREYLYPEGKFNAAALGKDADVIAAAAGFEVPAGTLVLVMPIRGVGRHEPFSKEKLCPVLGYVEVNGSDEAIRVAQSMLNIMGKGHSATLHANDPALAVRYGRDLPVCRIAVNAEGTLGSSGFITGLNPSATIGTGFFGRSSIDDNVGPGALVQWTRVAYNLDPAEVFGDMQTAARLNQDAIENGTAPVSAPARAAQPSTSDIAGLDRAELKDLLREIMTEELRGMLLK